MIQDIKINPMITAVPVSFWKSTMIHIQINAAHALLKSLPFSFNIIDFFFARYKHVAQIISNNGFANSLGCKDIPATWIQAWLPPISGNANGSTIMNKQSGTINHSAFEYHRKRNKRFINHMAIYPHTQNTLCLTITFGTMLGAYVVFPTLVDTIVNVPINKRSDTAQLIYLSHFGSNAKNDNFPFFFCSDM